MVVLSMTKIDFNMAEVCQNGFDGYLYKSHVSINERMKEIGVEIYYEKVKELFRY